MRKSVEPVSPSGRMLGTSELSACVHVVAELKNTVDIKDARKNLMAVMLPKQSRFSSILNEDENGNAKWVETEVDINQHVIEPEFPPGLEFYDDLVEEYISDLHIRQLPRNKPLWECHFINYKTKAAPATCVLNIHHLLGDGASLLSLARACSESTPIEHNSSNEQSYDSSSGCDEAQRKSNSVVGFFRWILIAWYTLVDIFSDLIRFKFMGDTGSPLKGSSSVMYLPRSFGFARFEMADVQLIKNALGGTVNDVVMGVIFGGVNRYMHEILKQEHGDEMSARKKMKEMRTTVLGLMNTRSDNRQQSINEMTKPKSQNGWGNKFAFLPLRIPMEEVPRAADYVLKAKAMMDRKKQSYAAYITRKVLSCIVRLKGPQASSRTMYNMINCTSFSASNVIGPKEMIKLGSIVVESWYFWISGVPQALMVSIVSYVGEVRVQVVGAKGVIDAELLSKCFATSFEDIKADIASSPSISKKAL